jgi:hypothetical protein
MMPNPLQVAVDDDGLEGMEIGDPRRDLHKLLGSGVSVAFSESGLGGRTRFNLFAVGLPFK